MSEIIKPEVISRRKALSLLGLAAAFGLAVPPTVLTVSDAEAQYTTTAPGAPAAAPAPAGKKTEKTGKPRKHRKKKKKEKGSGEKKEKD